MPRLFSRGPAMARKHIARDPRTGLPIEIGGARHAAAEAGIRPPQGPWGSLLPDQILPLANGIVGSVEVRWGSKRMLLDRTDGVRALPATRRRDEAAAHDSLLGALRAKSTAVRIAGLDVLLHIALRGGDDLFDALDERIDDADPDVRTRARECLKECAPIFPSALEEMIREQLRSEDLSNRSDAFETLRAAAAQWPEVGVVHVDELIREEEVDLRRRGSRILRSFAPRAGAAGWDLIGWCLQDEDAQVRRGASQSLSALAGRAPEIAQLLIEGSLFDEDEMVRRQSLRALDRVDKDSVRARDLIIDAARHRDRNIRLSCIKMLPIILGDQIRRETADELLRQETDPELRELLTDLARDPSLEGTEDEKNRFLAPAPKVDVDPADMFAVPTLPDGTGTIQPVAARTTKRRGEGRVGSGDLSETRPLVGAADRQLHRDAGSDADEVGGLTGADAGGWTDDDVDGWTEDHVDRIGDGRTFSAPEDEQEEQRNWPRDDGAAAEEWSHEATVDSIDDWLHAEGDTEESVEDLFESEVGEYRTESNAGDSYDDLQADHQTLAESPEATEDRSDEARSEKEDVEDC